MSPLVITGMHRSGTSATARLLQQAGLDVGSQLIAPTLDNPLGYYEDIEFCDLNLDLVAAGVGDDPQHRPDWAFADRIVPSLLTPLRPRAEALLAARSERGHAWGFKDPRTAVLLDFYDELAPDARYLFVYRAPWEVLTSLLSTQERPLHGRADLAVHAWTIYNTRLLEFRERYPLRTVLVHLDAVARQPDEVIDLVQAQGPSPVRLDAAGAREAFVGRLIRRTDASSALAELLAADHPEAMDVYARLEASADLPAQRPTASRCALAVEIETLRGVLDVAAVLVGVPAVGVEDATRIARPAAGAAPGESADAAIARLPDDLVAILFDGQLRRDALTTAVAALQDDPGLAAVLLAPGTLPQPAFEHDPRSRAEAGAGVVVRRATWLATRGFAAVQAPAGYEGWTFAVACTARGARVARIAGALHLPGAERDDADVRRRVLDAVAAGLALGEDAEVRARNAEVAAQAADERADRAVALAVAAEERASAADAEQARVLGLLGQMQSSRTWRLAARWWRFRNLFRSTRPSTRVIMKDRRASSTADPS